MKWVGYMNFFPLRQLDKVADATSRIISLLTEMRVEELGVEDLKNLYEIDLDFARNLESL